MGKVKASPDMLERIKKTKHMGGIQSKVVHKIPGVTGSLSESKKPDTKMKAPIEKHGTGLKWDKKSHEKFKKMWAQRMVNKKPD